MLSDGEYHCPTNELFMKDDRKRFSELRRKGFEFESPLCNLHSHTPKVVMRRVLQWPASPITAPPSDLNPKKVSKCGGIISEADLDDMFGSQKQEIKEAFLQTSLFN